MSKENYIPRLLELYNSEIQENLKKELNLDNIMRVPKLKKISLNIGLGDGKLNKNGIYCTQWIFAENRNSDIY